MKMASPKVKHLFPIYGKKKNYIYECLKPSKHVCNMWIVIYSDSHTEGESLCKLEHIYDGRIASTGLSTTPLAEPGWLAANGVNSANNNKSADRDNSVCVTLPWRHLRVDAVLIGANPDYR